MKLIVSFLSYQGTGIPLLPEVQSNKLLRPIADIGYGRVVDFDTEICGVPRIKFLLSWLQNLGGPSGAAQAVLEGIQEIKKKALFFYIFCLHKNKTGWEKRDDNERLTVTR